MSIRYLAGAVAGFALVAASPAATRYTATMNGAEETPATGETGTGMATFSLDGSTLTYTITAKGLTGPATAAHIHVGARGVAGPPVYTFVITPVASGTVAKGSIDLSKPTMAGVSGDSLRTLINNGNAYVNVHTAKHAAGEIRGQVVKK